MKYRFVDEIIDLQPGKNIHCLRTWPSSLDLFDDHFPGFPVVPGVLLTEMMGQAAGLCLESDESREDAAMLIKIKDATFKGWVEPDVQLDVFATIESAQEKFARITAKTEKGGVVVAQCELLLGFQSKDKLGLPGLDPVLAAYLANRQE